MENLLKKEIAVIKKAPMAEMYYLAKTHMKQGDKLINFASGHPSQDVFQEELLFRYFCEAMKENTDSVLQYGSHAGYQPLRECVKDFLNQKGDIVRDKDNILITYGATEGIFLTAMAFLNPGDRVIVEEPTYVNSIEIFKTMGAQLVPVEMEDDGINLEQVEEEMKKGVKLVYTVPNFGNPSGVTMSLEKRKLLSKLANKYNCIILEDNPYGDLRYRNARIPNIKELDESERTVYVGSVSKIIAPGLRVGFMVAKNELIKKLIVLKGVSSNGVSTINQYVVCKMLTEKDMYEEIKKICDIYSKRLLVMEKSMEKYFPSYVKKSSPDGGMYMWVTLPENVDIQKFCKESAERLHIPITPGNLFCVSDPQKCTSMRFNFVKENCEDIELGIKIVGKLIHDYCK